uniref:murein hydrolase activator EnvC family protein n=1 Tax=Trichocoleus desertorum TaxID=1481672 RepID=UPI0025B49E1B|nr:M23 family metallopeptidase [Trichocoleus desertorum]
MTLIQPLNLNNPWAWLNLVKWFKCALVFSVVFSLWLSGLAAPTYATPTAPIQVAQTVAQTDGALETLQEQQKLVEKQRSEIQKERDRIQKQEKAAKNRIGTLRQNLQVTDVQIKDNQYRLQLAKKQLKELQADLAIAERTYQKSQSAAVARLRFLQRQQGGQGWAVLLQSQNLNDFLDRRYRLRKVYQADRNGLAKLTAESRDLVAQKQQVEQKKNQIALLAQQLLVQQSELQAQSRSEQELVERLRSDQSALEAAEAQLAQDSESLTQLILQRVAEQRAKEAKEAAAGQGSIVIRGTGLMSIPSDGPITSGFGWRTHPILGYERFHSGTDFGADYGSTIRAANAGIVIYAGWYGGYGNAIVIDHGNDITTLYGHASELYVAEGQVVQRGQAIASVGSTGLSTGPHLHFEVRQAGEPVDPMNYF